MNIKKILTTLIAMNILELALTLYVLGLVINRDNSAWHIVLIVAVFLTVFSGCITVFGFNLMNKLKNEGLTECIKNLEQLNTKLREQRHDYLNHIQVIYGLMEIGEYEEAKKYMDPVFEQINKVSLAMKTAQPAVNALLQGKMQMAEKQNVKMYLKISTDLKKIPFEPWELCKALSNLIDNGITALNKNTGKKEMNIEMLEDDTGYQIKIANNGPRIQEEKISRIFEKGYSTKKENGHGMGLFIVKNIIEEAGGNVTVKSDEKETAFCLRFGKLQQSNEILK